MDELRGALLAQLDPGQALERVSATLGDSGHARLLAWWVLSHGAPGDPGEPPMLRELADQIHAERVRRAPDGEPPPSYEDAAFTVRLAAAAMFGEALIGTLLTRSAGLPDHAAARFRAWFARKLSD